MKTDISQFYPSIYTHAVDWAIRGKGKAKAQIRAPGLGPDLDSRLRNSRGGQTIGLSIGPDTSWLVAEVVLARVDEALTNKFPKIEARCARFGDDMTLYAESSEEAHEVLASYQRMLSDYELSLNPTKVIIVDGLVPHDATWIRELRSHRYRDNKDSLLAADILDIFQLALEKRRNHAHESVLSYAIKRCNPFPAGAASWLAYRDIILSAITVEPSALPHAYEVLVFARDHGLPVDSDRIADVLNEACARHAALDHGFEVSWILYVLRELRLSLDVAAAKEVAKMSDTCSLILLQDMMTRSKRLRANVDTNAAVRRAETPDALSTEDWLLAYEFRHNRWARPCKWDDSQSWKEAHKAQVNFFTGGNLQRKVKLRRRRPRFVPSWTYPTGV